MIATNGGLSTAAEPVIVISRVFDAPRELVWKVFTQPEHMVHTFSPRGFTTIIDEVNLKPGGSWRWRMRTPDGQDFHNHYIYTEIKEPELIAYTEEREIGHPFKLGARTTLTFEDENGRTRLTMRMVFSSVADRDAIARTGFVGAVGQGLQKAADHMRALQGLDEPDHEGQPLQ